MFELVGSSAVIIIIIIAAVTLSVVKILIYVQLGLYDGT
jgi:hypothetical protein